MSAPAAEPAEPRRPTPTERMHEANARLHELAMTFATRPSAQPEHSCELTRNAKGATQIALTVRGTDAAEVVALACELYEGVRSRYPLPSGYVGAEGEPAEPKAKP